MSAGHSPAAVRLTAADVYPSAGILGARVSPDGSQIGLVYRSFREVSLDGEELRTRALADLQLIPADGGPARPVFGSGETITSVAWSPLSASTLAVYRDEAPSLTIHELGDPAGRVIFRQTLHRPGLEHGDDDLGEPRWSPDGSRLLVAVREEREAHLIELAADGGRWRRLLTTPGAPVSWDWSPDGARIVALVSRQEATTADLLVIDVASGERRLLGEERHLQYREPVARWSPSGGLVVRSNRSGWSKLWAVDPESGAARPISEGAWDEGAFQIAADGRIVATSNREQDGLGNDLWLFDETGATGPQRLTRHPGVNAPIGWAGDDRIVYWHADGRGESDLWVQSCSGATRTQMTATAPLATMAKIRAPEEIVISTEAGPLTGLLHRPAGAAEGERFPGVVWVHGGPASAVRPVWSAGAGFCHLLANEGFLVLNVNFRGSTEHGVDHMNAVSGEGVGANDLADVTAAGEYLRGLTEIDAARGVGIAGRSWGGYLTLMALTTAPDVFACGFAGAAVSDWAIQQAEGDVRYYDYWLLGGWAYNRPDLVAARSPITHVEGLRAPLLVTHGEADPNVPPGQMRTFVERALAAGKQVDAHWYPHEGHVLALRDNQQDELERMVRFFRRWLHPWDFVDNPSGGQVTS
jgi:dipeptidyl aminopeptidase/acylaminoacyl peptidase